MAAQVSELDQASGWRIALCALGLIGALCVVGLVSHTLLRHVVQTIPVWVTVMLGLRRSQWAKWVALPCFVCWLFLMTVIWLFLLGWAHLISGTFTLTEIAMTLIVGMSCIAGIAFCLRTKTRAGAAIASIVFSGMLIIQIVAIRVSFLHGIARD